MKRILVCLILAWVGMTSSSCDAATQTPVSTPIPTLTPTQPTPTPTIVWFPPSETPTAQALPALGPTPERKPGVGALLLSDDFSETAPWNPGASNDASLNVSRNTLTIAAQAGVNAFRVRQGTNLTNFYAEITAQPSLCRGDDEYGLLFRAPNSVAYYAFAVTCNGTSHAERVRMNRPISLHDPVASADVPLGPPGQVRLGVWVSGPDMHFFLNDHYQFSATDSTYKSGGVGAFARSMGDTPVTVIFSDLSVSAVTYVAPTSTPLP